ncbi:MAG: alpha-E domain-containing protein [Acidobacteria bacterium]|nr:alpha-E domain-containing protein [Acidobacteriota bacterium]MCG3190929.1 hypothetical protein [Thermoanaerobaculia bacterium]MCK6684548.1 alpha-E domain-containing protein [Thermoanaerobaculia bacterium]
MISRVADHCFWFGRYLERTESTARMLLVTQNLALDGELSARQCWRPLIIVSGEERSFVSSHGSDAMADAEAVQGYLTWDEENYSGIKRSIEFLRENARSIREVISLEVWEVANELHLWINSPAAAAEYRNHRYGFFRHIRFVSQLCLGLLRSTMLHDAPLNFIWLGVLLERVGQTARTLDVHHHAFTEIEEAHQVVETSLWLSLLRSCSGFEPFMKRHQGSVTGEAVASFLIFEPRFPRSIRYGLHAALWRFHEIRPPAEHALPGAGTEERLKELEHWLRAQKAGLKPAGIHDLLTHVVDETAGICNVIRKELLGVG